MYLLRINLGGEFMKKVIIYFVGGSSLELTECDEECIANFEKWLSDDSLKVFKVNNVKFNKGTFIRKDLVLFVSIN